MFFVKALGGSCVAVFGGLYFVGFFDNEAAVERAVEQVRAAEIADNKDARWGPECDGLRDKVMGVDESGAPAGLAAGNAIGSIAKLHAAERRLKAAGCDIDAAPGAINPFDPSREAPFREVQSQMDGDQVDGSEWGGDPNAFNSGGSDDWSVAE